MVTRRLTRMSETTAPQHRHAPDWLILTIACVAQFMVVLDVSIVNVALPHMGTDLGMNQTQVLWIVNAYVLTFAGFLLLGGRLADLYGRRKIYIIGVVAFTLASIVAGASHSGTEMIIARAVQGIGGAILSPATLTVIITTYQGPRMAKAIGAWSAVAGAGGAVGVLAGGLLTGLVSWRWVFYVNVPFGIVATIAAVLYLQEKRNQSAENKLDYTGAVLVTGGLSAFIYAVVNTTTHAWGSATTLGWMAGGIVALIAFLFWEAKVASHPILVFRLFHSRPLSVANIVMLMAGGAFYALWYFLTFYFQEVLGYGPVHAGFSFLPMAVCIIGGAQFSSRLVPKIGVRPLVWSGTIVATVGFYLLSLLGVHSSYWSAILLPGCLCSLAMGLLFAPLATAATSKVDRKDSGLASGVLNASRQVGGSLALAILGTIAADRTAAVLRGAMNPAAIMNQAHVDGYSRGFEIAAAITLAAFFVSLAMPDKVGHHSSHAAPSPQPAGAAGH